MAEIFAPLLAGVPLWAPPPNVIKERGVAGIELRIEMDLLGGYRHTDRQTDRQTDSRRTETESQRQKNSYRKTKRERLREKDRDTNVPVSFLHQLLIQFHLPSTHFLDSLGIAFAAATAGVTRLTLLPSQLSSVITMMPDLGNKYFYTITYILQTNF